MALTFTGRCVSGESHDKVRSLMRLGVRVQSAVACGITSKGPWRSSKTPGINQALSNAYLKRQGLYELRDGWVKLTILSETPSALASCVALPSASMLTCADPQAGCCGG